MLTRIVKLTFQEEKIDDFLAYFNTINTRVSTFENCYGMRLMQDMYHPYIVFTYSNWKDESALNRYRDSELFRGVWSTIKPWFGGKPEAWSVETQFEDGTFSPNHPEN
ncbi:antibiotic biosynthesis monooxygenase family protein [Fluviicola sp.]|uniref:putative quinol monooxygenase n=1 Tax=Fluviicola sp. TaxID=1917219 RepID=UPI002830C486|nr:antibiotic biosynthesis monooxygenase family protein [Fluviicola sp.]MDR0801060.1 antibiotic biosynthesis monooxygenase [Fluviicola sp.]